MVATTVAEPRTAVTPSPSRPRRPSRFIDPLAIARAGRRHRRRRGELAVAVVRRECHDFCLRGPLNTRPVADARPHRRRARFVLPPDARLVQPLPGDRVLVAGSQLPGRRDRRSRCGGLRETVPAQDHRGVCGRRVRHPAARDVGRRRSALVCVDGGRGGLADRLVGYRRTPTPARALGVLRARADARDIAQPLSGVARAGLRRRDAGAAAQ